MKRIFFATLLVVMMSAVTVLAAGWEQIYIDGDDNTIYMDPSTVKVSVRGTDNTTFSASFKQVFSERGRNNMIEWYRNNTNVAPGLESLSYDVTTIQFKKEGNEGRYYCITDRISYTADGKPIDYMHYTNNNITWQEVPLASLIEVEYYNALLVTEGKDFAGNN